MAGTWKFYVKGLRKILDGTVKPSTSNTRMHLMQQGYLPYPESEEAWYSVEAKEVTGSGYTGGATGGLAVSSLYWTTNTTDDPPWVGMVVSFPAWSSATLEAYSAVLVTSYVDQYSATQYALIAYLVDDDGAIALDGSVSATSPYPLFKFQVPL